MYMNMVPSTVHYISSNLRENVRDINDENCMNTQVGYEPEVYY